MKRGTLKMATINFKLLISFDNLNKVILLKILFLLEVSIAKDRRQELDDSGP